VREWRELLETHGAILSGHFELSSGRHSGVYVQKARILERPEPTLEIGREIASWYSAIDVVVAPAVGAIVLGFAVALAADARSVFAEREGGRLRLRRGFGLERGERTLVVEDVITTGGSAKEVHDMVGLLGAERLGVAALVDRSTGPLAFPLRSVVRVEADSWEPAVCPLCRNGVSIDSPGSKRLQPRSG
jgi:orotate phosphoribosyltransferase